MNKIYILLLAALLLAFSACKKDTHILNQTVVDNYIYDTGNEVVYQSNVEKTKQKNTGQFISILYANLFQSSIGQQELTDLSELRIAIGDKQMADELIMNGYINDPTVQIPTDAQMRADIDQFINDTYLRFFLRYPTPYEKVYFKELIEEDPGLSPQLIYNGFAVSNEYKYY